MRASLEHYMYTHFSPSTLAYRVTYNNCVLVAVQGHISLGDIESVASQGRCGTGWNLSTEELFPLFFHSE